MATDQLRLVFMPGADLREATRACEADVFLDRYKIPRSQMLDDYGPYDDVSVWLSVIDARGDVVAGSRLVPPNPKGLKSIDDVCRPPWSLDGRRIMSATGMDPERTWDVATLFRRRGLAAAPITAALCHGVIMSLRHNDGNALVAILDAVARAMLDRGFGLRMHTMPGASRQMFMNTPNDPTYVFMSDLLDNSRRVNPEGYRMYAHGAGLDGIDLPAPEDFRLTRRLVDVRDRPGAAFTVPAQWSRQDEAPRAV
jgi:hypothetical protein